MTPLVVVIGLLVWIRLVDGRGMLCLVALLAVGMSLCEVAPLVVLLVVAVMVVAGLEAVATSVVG